MSASTAFFRHVQLSELTLRVKDLEGSVRFYREALGMQTLGTDNGRVRLGHSEEGPALVVLEAAPDAPARPRDSAGLFHVAFLYPNRRSLGRAARRLLDLNVPFGGGDHGVSEALYLSDSEGNGIELYVDRPLSEWPASRDGEVAMYTEEVDFESLLREGEKPPVEGEPVRIGHIHLSVADLATTEQVLAGGLGFPVRQRNYPGALFFGRDGYHHHFGANVWRSRRGALRGALGLERFTLSLSPAPALGELSTDLRQLGVFTEQSTDNALDVRTIDGIGIRITGFETDEA